MMTICADHRDTFTPINVYKLSLVGLIHLSTFNFSKISTSDRFFLNAVVVYLCSRIIRQQHIPERVFECNFEENDSHCMATVAQQSRSVFL